MFDWMAIGYVIVVVAVVFAAIVAWEAVRKKVRGIIFPPPHKEERGRGGGMVGSSGGGCGHKCGFRRETETETGEHESRKRREGKGETIMAVITESKMKIEMIKRRGAMEQLHREILERLGAIKIHTGISVMDIRCNGKMKSLTERLAESRKLMDEIEAMHREYVTMLAEERLMEVGVTDVIGAVVRQAMLAPGARVHSKSVGPANESTYCSGLK